MIADVTQALGTDYYLLEEMISDEEREIRDKVRAFVDREIIPSINEYWEKAEFPFEVIPKIAELNIVGTTIESYGCPGMSHIAAGLAVIEMSRGDGSINTFLGVHSGLAMGTIAMLGSEEQKEKWLPPMARMEKIGAFGLTEPEHGSDSVMLETSAKRKGEARGRRVHHKRREALDRQCHLRRCHHHLGARRRRRRGQRLFGRKG